MTAYFIQAFIYLCAAVIAVPIAKRLGLPCQAYLGLSDARGNDPQMGFESGLGAMLAALGGINVVAGPGMLDYVNCFSLEKLVFDDEIAGCMNRVDHRVFGVDGRESASGSDHHGAR